MDDEDLGGKWPRVTIDDVIGIVVNIPTALMPRHFCRDSERDTASTEKRGDRTDA